MLDLVSLGTRISEARKAMRLTQAALAQKAGISRATVDALENGRSHEIGFVKLSKLLATLGLELHLQTATSRRPTLEDLLAEDRDDAQGLG